MAAERRRGNNRMLAALAIVCVGIAMAVVTLALRIANNPAENKFILCSIASGDIMAWRNVANVCKDFDIRRYDD